MKIIVVGGTGTLGSKIADELGGRHEIIRAGSKSGDATVDITSSASIQSLYKKIGSFDALVSAAGSGYFGPFDTMTEDDFYKGIKSKMMGQINLVMLGKDLINEGGSFTLTSGILHSDPVKGGVGLSILNGALNSFAKSAAYELKRSIRLNVVSPGLVEDSEKSLGSSFPGHVPITMKRMVSGYVKSVEGIITGQVIEIV
ncbi:MAG TPA: short chain dehydrogenase [Cyclobacteriaceae bacterium]|nr:short chain dehydrogenase [Cyclobacteriaceae bacterium]